MDRVLGLVFKLVLIFLRKTVDFYLSLGFNAARFSY